MASPTFSLITSLLLQQEGMIAPAHDKIAYLVSDMRKTFIKAGIISDVPASVKSLVILKGHMMDTMIKDVYTQVVKRLVCEMSDNILRWLQSLETICLKMYTSRIFAEKAEKLIKSSRIFIISSRCIKRDSEL